MCDANQKSAPQHTAKGHSCLFFFFCFLYPVIIDQAAFQDDLAFFLCHLT